MHPSIRKPNSTANSHMMANLEPSDEWKATLKRRIEAELAFMVKDAKDQLEESIQCSPNDRNRLLADHQTIMANICRLAEEQFREELGRERQERRWAAGMSLENNWMESLREEQEVIYQQIKKGPLPEGVADAADGGPQEQLPELRRPPQMISQSPRARSDLAQVRSLSLTFLVDLFPFPSAPERILGQLLARHSRLFRAFPLRASKEKSSHHLSFRKKKSCVIWRI